LVFLKKLPDTLAMPGVIPGQALKELDERRFLDVD
jgi:hypothetical protein